MKQRIDAHTHMIGDHPELIKLLERWNLKIFNISVPDDQWAPWRRTEHVDYERLAKTWPNRFAWCTTFDVPGPADFENPHYADRQIELLERDFTNGAIACKLYYNIGQVVKAPDGSFLQIDHPMFEPIFRYLDKRRCPVLWHFGGDEGARHRVLEKYRGLRFIGAHLGTLPDCKLEEISGLLDRHPNFDVDTAATVRRLLKQDPKAVRDFFIKYQDRILFGTDLGAFEAMVSYAFSSLPADKLKENIETLRTAYETHFAYYEKAGPMKVFEWGFFDGVGLNLPEPVLEKIYYANAIKCYPGLR